jgi:hypothetical protein
MAVAKQLLEEVLEGEVYGSIGESVDYHSECQDQAASLV